ncbi:MAG: hypothetical protein HQL54_07390 [Magnetococcales bacterium]|nr:hypothetical protein [Magnetococcales bacterium]
MATAPHHKLSDTASLRKFAEDMAAIIVSGKEPSTFQEMGSVKLRAPLPTDSNPTHWYSNLNEHIVSLHDMAKIILSSSNKFASQVQLEAIIEPFLKKISWAWGEARVCVMAQASQELSRTIEPLYPNLFMEGNTHWVGGFLPAVISFFVPDPETAKPESRLQLLVSTKGGIADVLNTMEQHLPTLLDGLPSQAYMLAALPNVHPFDKKCSLKSFRRLRRLLVQANKLEVDVCCMTVDVPFFWPAMHRNSTAHSKEALSIQKKFLSGDKIILLPELGKKTNPSPKRPLLMSVRSSGVEWIASVSSSYLTSLQDGADGSHHKNFSSFVSGLESWGPNLEMPQPDKTWAGRIGLTNHKALQKALTTLYPERTLDSDEQILATFNPLLHDLKTILQWAEQYQDSAFPFDTPDYNGLSQERFEELASFARSIAKISHSHQKPTHFDDTL